jgi:bleomycin hydrolase
MELTYQKLIELKKDFQSSPVNKLAMNAATRVEIQELAMNREVAESINFCFSHEIETAPEATAQKKVGICWMYAGFNWCREAAQKKLNVESMEFAGPYLVFWDKLEKTNYFLQKMVEFIEQPTDERIMWMFLKNPPGDEGCWHVFTNLVKKYGLLPKSAMPDTKYTEESTRINTLFSYKLRQYADELRRLYRAGRTREELEHKCAEYLTEMYRFLAITLGVPPQRFDWSYRDKNKNFHRLANITPQEFYEQVVGVNVDETYALWHLPMADMPYYQPYTVIHTPTMIGVKPVVSVNLPMAELKKYALQMLQNGEVCLFSCDVGQESQRKEGVLYKGLYDYGLIFQSRFDAMDKGTRLEYGEGKVSHSMVLTGVDLVENKPLKWKVENSWGAEVGKKGYFIMSDEWFEEYGYEVIIPGKYLEPSLLEIFRQKPVVLPYWHPMA